MKLFSSKRRWLVAAVVLLLLFVLRPGVSRLKSRVILSISSGVGRPVDIGSVHFRLLPRPGFDLANLVVYDDPTFGPEPILRCGRVTAWLRLTSLARGRLEIARLSLTDPSLNLTHGQNGRWNVEGLLERTVRMPLAPTAKPRSEPRPGFPYIEATSARINLKSGAEKKPYALTNADFSLWQDSENTWGLRLQGQPIRSDLNSNDTGLLRINGRWQRAGAFRDIPLDFSLDWSGAQLGQVTKLFTRNDQGWRGGVQFEAKASGTPAKLSISANTSIEDFRRYDITSGQVTVLAVHCEGQYSSSELVFHEVACRAPVGNGQITLKGDLGLPGSQHYEIELAAENVPASALVTAAGRAKKNLPSDLKADGVISARLSAQKDPVAFLFEGTGKISQFHLSSALNKFELGPENVPFTFRADNSEIHLNRTVVGQSEADGPRLEFGPFSLGKLDGEPRAQGWINRSGYKVTVTGQASVGSTLRAARVFGIPALQTIAEGEAQLDLEIAGSWAAWDQSGATGFREPQVEGIARLQNVKAGIRGTGGPVEIVSGELQFSPAQMRITKLSVKAAGTTWAGNLEMPRGCGTTAECNVHFNVHAKQLDLSELNDWVSPQPKKRPWYRVLQSNVAAAPPFLASLRGKGIVTAERLQVQRTSATHVTANVSIEGGTVEIADLRADILGAEHRGIWRADLAAQPPICSGTGRLKGFTTARLGELMQDDWISGIGTAQYQLKGPCAAEFWHTAEGVLQFEITNGALAHLVLADYAEPLRFSRLQGKVALQEGSFEFQDATLDSPYGKFQLSGTASLKRELKLTLMKAKSATLGYNVTGTVAVPHVVALPGTEQARLKAEPAK